ncbi:hypothetical protein KXW51_007881, partial [Aspergillus fumigatus]
SCSSPSASSTNPETTIEDTRRAVLHDHVDPLCRHEHQDSSRLSADPGLQAGSRIRPLPHVRIL